ncbi:MAG: molybdenum cofactor biosynthesis protein B [Arenicella sp.]|nr:molybdenum cofactor biosynthesis protein B [Arenicella sp.]
MSNTDGMVPLNVALLTVSDTRQYDSDTSGQYLAEQIQSAGHKLVARDIVIDDVYLLRARVSAWIADPEIHAAITTGGTGFTERDSTPEALMPLFDKQIDGFGELFRQLSYDDIGTSTVQSRALGGIANKTVIFCVPGSTGACKTAWEGIIKQQLDSRHRPCNFVTHTSAV